MAKKKKLTTLQHGGILYSRNRGESYSTIARNVKCRKTTVHDILKRTEAETTIVKKHPGRKPIFDTPALEELKRLVIQDTNYSHLSAHKSFFRQFLSSHNIRVWCTPAKEFVESCLVPTVDRSPGLYTQLMRKYGISAIHQLVPNGKAIDFFDNAGISMLSWPPQSPDLNPLENLWQEVESRLHSSLDKLTSIEDLEEKVKATWNSIPPRYYYGLVNSMSNQ
ncbi:8069_t:CDS:2, partial [Racocetra persica]